MTLAKNRLTIIVVIANYNLFHLAVFAHLAQEVFVERVKVILKLAGIHLVFGIESRILI